MKDRLGTLVSIASRQLRESPSWYDFVRARQGPSYLSTKIDDIEHSAREQLQDVRDHGVPVPVRDEPWDADKLDECVRHGAHKSAQDHAAFLREEMADFMEANFWTVLPYDQVRDLPDIRLSPAGIKEERERRPRVVIDHTWYGVNDNTEPSPFLPAMQFGGTLPRILWRLRHADPRYGPVHMAKYDVADGFYRLHLNANDAPKLAVILPAYPGEPQLIAIPLSTTMGWVSSPPTFCAASETIADLSNKALARGEPAAPHRLEAVAKALDEPTPATASERRDDQPTDRSDLPPPRTREPGSNTPWPLPLRYVDVFVDDFIALVQGDERDRDWVRATILNKADLVFAPPGPDDDKRKEPISEKKLRRGDGSWATRKEILGWILDAIAGTLELPERRFARLRAIFNEL